MAGPAASLRFTVRRKAAELVTPAGPTPRELKRLSDIDDQDGLRFHIPVIQFYRRDASMAGRDPAAVVRDALARALVHYYPFAGRLRELEGRKLAVDCTGEGVLFVEADADVRLEQFGADPQPPFPCLDELIFDVPGSSALLDTPLFLFQVTRLACGGFVFGVRMQHTIADGPGLAQFLSAVAEMAGGAAAPTVRPVWGRELLEAPRDSDRLPRSFAHREYDEVPDTNGTIVPLDSMTHRSFFFGPQEMAAIRSHLPPSLRSSATTFEALTGCLWRCRTVALGPGDEEEMRMICIVNLRGKSSIVPRGYYGNALAFPAAVSTAGNLCTKPVGYAVQLVRKAKREVDMEYLQSVARLMVRRQRPGFTVVRGYLVSDVSKIGFRDLDLGWGKPVYAGPAKSGVGTIPGIASFFIAFRNAMGEDGIVVPVCLPHAAMDKFVEEMGKLLMPADNIMATTEQLAGNVFSMIKAAL